MARVAAQLYGFNPRSPFTNSDKVHLDVKASHESKHLTRPKYRSDIDGLRAIAVFFVVIFHAFPLLCPGGFIGVDIFFVISGFLISTIIFANLERDSFRFLEFYSRRIKRIFPALVLMLAASYAFGWFALFADEYRQLGKHIAAGAGFFSNFVLWQENGYFDNAAATKPLLHLWSLGIEEQFYIIWPLLLWISWRSRLNLLTVTCSVAAVSFYLNVWEVHANPLAAFYSPQTRFWELMAGAALAHLSLNKRHLFRPFAHKFKVTLGSVKSAKSGHVTLHLDSVLSVVGATFIIAGLIAITEVKSFPGWWAILPTAGSVLIISAGPEAWLNRTILSNRILVWFGLISYPLYLWHWPLLSFDRIVKGDLPVSAGTRIALVAISIGLAWLTYRFVELPIRRQSVNAAKVPMLLLVMLIVAGVGYFAFKFDGLPARSAVKHAERINAQFEGPFWKYTKNDICLRRYPFREAADYGWWFCMASKDEKPTLLLLGNSFANEFYAGLVNNEAFHNQSVLSIGTCRPDGEPTNSDITSPCYGDRSLHQEQFIDQIIATSESLKYVIIDGFEPDKGSVARLKRRIDFIAEHNAKVILFLPHLRLNYDIRECFARPFNNNPKRSCEIQISERSRADAMFKAVVDQLRHTNTEVLVFDQNQVFCNNERCSMVRNGMPLLRDAFHISEYGSMELAKIFQKWVAIHAPDLLR